MLLVTSGIIASILVMGITLGLTGIGRVLVLGLGILGLWNAPDAFGWAFFGTATLSAAVVTLAMSLTFHDLEPTTAPA